MSTQQVPVSYPKSSSQSSSVKTESQKGREDGDVLHIVQAVQVKHHLTLQICSAVLHGRVISSKAYTRIKPNILRAFS